MEILLNKSIPLSAWRTFLSINSHATPFQSSEFCDLFNSVDGLFAEAFAIADSVSLRALAVVTIQKESGLKGYFSRRAIIYGGALTDEVCPESLKMLIEEILTALKRKVIYIEFRNLSDYSNLKYVYFQQGFKYIPYLNFRVATGELKSMSALVSNSRMRQIAKARKTGVTWEIAQNLDEMKNFYEILSILYIRKIGKPLLPFTFFRNFFESGLGKYLLVIYKNKIIGGMMCLIFEKKAIYEFYVCGLDEDYKEQYPSVMATWAAMEYANQNNIPIFDFMGAGKPEESYGVRNFKARFGGELVEYGRFMIINRPILYHIGRAGLTLMKLFN